MMPTIAKTVWDCRQARVEIALKAGGDLEDPVAAGLLEAHLTDCADCRSYLARMERSLDVLQGSAAPLLSGGRLPSLWPCVAQRLSQVRPSRAAGRFNLWVPTGAMAVACAAMILVTIVQIERVAPFEPLITPHLRTVFIGETPDRFRDDQEFGRGRLPVVSEPAFPVSLPVTYPADSRAIRLDVSGGEDSPSRWQVREW